jgi:hypothetical protein
LSFGSVLSSCPNFRALFLSRNPVERTSKYRSVVHYLIPNLEMLDGTPLDAISLKKLNQNIIDEASAELKLIVEEMDEENRLENDIYGSSLPPSANASLDKKFSALYMSNYSNPAYQSVSSLNGSMNSEVIPDTGSELTHGSSVVLAGNVAAAMRRRRTEKSSSTGSSSSRPENSKEFESALDVLDGVLISSSKSESLKDNSSKLKTHPSFLKEGDITEAVMGPPSAIQKNRGYPSSSLELDANNEDLELDLESLLKSPQEKGIASKMKGSENTSSRRPQSAVPGTSSRFSERPPSSSQPGNRNSNFSPHASSPRQRNSSRPQSAVDRVKSNPLFDNLKFDFAASNNSSASATARKNRRAGDDDDDDDSEDEIQLTNNIRKIVPMMKVNDEDVLKKSGTSGGIGSSIVHLDIVKRNKKSNEDRNSDSSRSSSSNRPSSSSKGSSHASSQRSGRLMDNDSEDEDIAITHSERLRLMSTASTNPVNSLCKTRQTVLLKLQSKPSTLSRHAEGNLGDEEETGPDLFQKTSVVDLQNDNSSGSDNVQLNNSASRSSQVLTFFTSFTSFVSYICYLW